MIPEEVESGFAQLAKVLGGGAFADAAMVFEMETTFRVVMIKAVTQRFTVDQNESVC